MKNSIIFITLGLLGSVIADMATGVPPIKDLVKSQQPEPTSMRSEGPIEESKSKELPNNQVSKNT